VALDPVPAAVTVGPDLLQHVQHPHLPAGLALVLLGVDDVVEGGAGSGFGLSAAARCRTGRGRLLGSAGASARSFVQDLDQQRDAARFPHGDAAVLRAGQSQQSPRHLLLISVSEHGEQPEHHLHLRRGGGQPALAALLSGAALLIKKIAISKNLSGGFEHYSI